MLSSLGTEQGGCNGGKAHHRCHGGAIVSKRSREPRQEVFLRARMQTGDGWRDVTIRNVSSRGLLGYSSTAPGRGHYVELRYRSFCLVGRVVWSGDDRFGIRLQDALDVPRLLSDTALPQAVERRAVARPAAERVCEAPTAEAFERSRRLASAFQRACILAVAAAAALLLADEVRLQLGGPLQAAGLAMHESNPDRGAAELRGGSQR